MHIFDYLLKNIKGDSRRKHFAYELKRNKLATSFSFGNRIHSGNTPTPLPVHAVSVCFANVEQRVVNAFNKLLKYLSCLLMLLH